MAYRELRLTSPHMKGPDVQAAQRLLAGNHWRDYDPGPADGEWGVLSQAATRRALYDLGRSKGVVRRAVYTHQLEQALRGKAGLSLAQKARRAARLRKHRRHATTIGGVALSFAAKELGVTEHPAGSNDGPRVREYQAVTGAFKAPWCASFAFWALKRAGYRLVGGINYAYCPSILDAARAGRGHLHRIATPSHGDLVLYDWDHDGVADHIEFYDRAVTGGFYAIGGNTSPTDASNGGEVHRSLRYPSEVIAYVHVSRH